MLNLGILNTLEFQTFWSSVFHWSKNKMVSILFSFSNGPVHWKTKWWPLCQPFENRTDPCHSNSEQVQYSGPRCISILFWSKYFFRFFRQHRLPTGTRLSTSVSWRFTWEMPWCRRRGRILWTLCTTGSLSIAHICGRSSSASRSRRKLLSRSFIR